MNLTTRCEKFIFRLVRSTEETEDQLNIHRRALLKIIQEINDPAELIKALAVVENFTGTEPPVYRGKTLLKKSNIYQFFKSAPNKGLVIGACLGAFLSLFHLNNNQDMIAISQCAVYGSFMGFMLGKIIDQADYLSNMHYRDKTLMLILERLDDRLAILKNNIIQKFGVFI